MPEEWAVTYVVLWIVVVASLVLNVGTLRQVGILRLQLAGTPPASGSADIDAENDGPGIGSQLGALEAESVNGHGLVSVWPYCGEKQTLIALMSPVCEGCQHAVGPLDGIALQRADELRTFVVILADDYGARAFTSVFPLHCPVIADADRQIVRRLEVKGNPFGLLYDQSGKLVRKGVIDLGHDSVLALLGDGDMPERAKANIFPRPGDPRRSPSR